MSTTKRSAVRAALWGPLSALGLAVAACGFAIDRLSKWWLLDVYDIDVRQLVEVTPFLNLVMAWNRGISYGLFPVETLTGQYFLAGFAALVAVGLAIWLSRIERPMLAVAVGLIIGGALGNAYDRVRFGAVADFFSFHAFGYYWYIFNVADIWIVAGVALMVYDAVFPAPGGESRG